MVACSTFRVDIVLLTTWHKAHHVKAPATAKDQAGRALKALVQPALPEIMGPTAQYKYHNPASFSQ